MLLHRPQDPVSLSEPFRLKSILTHICFFFIKVPHLVQFFEDMQGTGVDALSAEERIELEKLRGEYERLKVKLSGSAVSKTSVEKVADNENKSDASSSSDSEVIFQTGNSFFFSLCDFSHLFLSFGCLQGED